MTKLDDVLSARNHHPDCSIKDNVWCLCGLIQARTELAALRRRAEDAEMLLKLAVQSFLSDCRLKDGRLQFAANGRMFRLEVDRHGLPILTDEARNALKAKP